MGSGRGLGVLEHPQLLPEGCLAPHSIPTVTSYTSREFLINTLCTFIIMAKRRSTKSLRMLDDWLNRPVAQRIRTASDNSTSGYVEDEAQDQEPHE